MRKHKKDGRWILPYKGRDGNDEREMLQQMGFSAIEVRDALFCYVKSPLGWSSHASWNPDWTEISDERGQTRLLFYRYVRPGEPTEAFIEEP